MTISNYSSHYAILGILGFGPMSGYQIRQFSHKTIENFWQCNYGDIYPALNDLIKLNYITKVANPVGQKKRNLYQITSQGQEALTIWLELECFKEQKKNPFLLKLFLAGHNPRTALTHVETFLSEQKNKLTKLKLLEESCSRVIIDNPGLERYVKYWFLSLDFGINTTKANIEWAQNKISLLMQLGL